MRATTDERAEFGRLLREALEAADLTQSELRRRLEADYGVKKSGTAVSNWVAGTFAPDRKTTHILDEIVRAGGRLLEALGYSSRGEPLVDGWLPPHLVAWGSQLPEQDLRRLMETVDAVARRVARDTTDRIVSQLEAVAAGDSDNVTMLGDPRSVSITSLVQAAHEGGEDDEVGPATKRPAVGSTPEEPAST